jgi:Protein of unknown function (DUF3830)
MARVALSIGDFRFTGRFEIDAAPESVAWLTARLPLVGAALHARWSGEAAWMPLGQEVKLDHENALSYPHPGQLLLYAGAKSEPELLIPYGYCAFASRAGALAGNHVITLDDDAGSLNLLGQALLHRGAHPLRLAQS